MSVNRAYDRCPECGSEGPFHIDVTTTVLVRDDGTEYDTGTDTLWSDDSWCMCAACDHTGTAADFTLDTERRLSKCADCGLVTANPEAVRHLATRVLPGEPMPSGECPECGALTLSIC